MTNEKESDKPDVNEIKNSSVIGLITNFKRKGMFEARLIEEQDEDKKYVFLKVGEEEFYIDLTENDLLANLLSGEEIASMIEELIVDNVRLGRNLRIASQVLTIEEASVLELSVKGYNPGQLVSKMGFSPQTLDRHKENITSKLQKDSFEDALESMKARKL